MNATHRGYKLPRLLRPFLGARQQRSQRCACGTFPIPRDPHPRLRCPFRRGDRAADHDRCDPGHRHRCDRGKPARRHRRSTQLRHEPHAVGDERHRRTFRVPPAATGPVSGNVDPCRLRHARAGQRPADSRTVDQPADRDESVRRGGNDDRFGLTDCHRIDTDRLGDDAERVDRREPAHPRTQVRRSAHADSRCEHRPGTGWRRDHVCRAARHLQQHQPRRRRLQQRVLRRAGRRPARRDRHHARSGQGVPGHRDRRAGGVRPDRGRGRQRHHQVGDEHAARQPLLLSARRVADRRALGRHATSTAFTASSGAARSAGRSRRIARSSSRALEGITRKLLAAEPGPSNRRDRLPGGEPDGAGQRGADQRQRGLPAHGAPQFHEHPARDG